MVTKQNWIVTFGNAAIEGGQITHKTDRVKSTEMVTTSTDGDQKYFSPHTILRSNVEFEQGTICWEVYFQESSSTCVLLLPAEPSVAKGGGAAVESNQGKIVDYELAFGLNILRAPYGFAALRNWNWEPILGGGQGSSIETGRWISVSVRVNGSTIDMYVDGICVLTTVHTLKLGQIGLFMQGDKPIKFRNLKVDAQQPMCFAVMQFTDDFNILYSDVIKPVCEEYGFSVMRGDDFHTSGQIMDDITQSIRSATLIIADVTPDNPNVFYEVGYAHGIGKPTILLSDRKREKLPFDISGFRTLFYDNTIGGKAIVEQRLRQHLDALRAR